MVPMMWRMMSLDETPTGRRPRSSKRIVSGTRNHCLPSAMATAVSVEPIPVAKAAIPAAVLVWESAPTITSPGFTYRSETRTWLIPSPTSASRHPVALTKSRSLLCIAAYSGRPGGPRWSNTIMARSGCFRVSLPMSWRITSKVRVPVPSCTSARSTGQITISPARTSRPSLSAEIFSASVMPTRMSSRHYCTGCRPERQGGRAFHLESRSPGGYHSRYCTRRAEDRGMPETKTMLINMGPQHPSTHGVLRLLLELDGEVVVKVTPHIGYLHTGMEKIMESKRYQQAITVTDRFDYLAPMSNI